MSITIELSPAILAMLQADAAREGTTVEALVTARAMAPYSVANANTFFGITEEERRTGARDAAHAQEILNGPRRSLKDSMNEMRVKFGFPDTSHLSPEEIEAQLEQAFRSIPPEKLAEAEQLGVL